MNFEQGISNFEGFVRLITSDFEIPCSKFDIQRDATEGKPCFLQAPEICVEVLSPSNTDSEIAEKKALSFEEGAREVWLTAQDGAPDTATAASAICAEFPPRI